MHLEILLQAAPRPAQYVGDGLRRAAQKRGDLRGVSQDSATVYQAGSSWVYAATEPKTASLSCVAAIINTAHIANAITVRVVARRLR